MDYLCGSLLVPSALVALKPRIINVFRFTRCDSVTGILADLSLSSFDTIMWNAKQIFSARRNN